MSLEARGRNCERENMILHITRHGQPAIGDLPPATDHEYPPGDPVLSVLGRQQAAWLGERLARTSFRGPIFSSPYRRTLETGAVIAEAIGAEVIPEAAFQEYVPRPGTPNFEGLTSEQICALFPRVRRCEALPYPWFVSGPETQVEVRARVRPFLEALLTSHREEVLLVGHGASVHAGIAELIGPERSTDDNAPVNWNCSLTTIEVGRGLPPRCIRLFDTEHVPAGSVTSNAMYRDRGVP